MKYLVTGGSGLIGSFLLPAIKVNGDDWRTFDIQDNYNVMDMSHIGDTLRADRPDVVGHLAAQSGVEASRSSGYDSFRLNVLGTVNVLEACLFHGVKNVVVASSNHVYGAQTVWPVPEDAPLNQLDTYSVSKTCADYITRAYAHNYGMNTVAAPICQ